MKNVTNKMIIEEIRRRGKNPYEMSSVDVSDVYMDLRERHGNPVPLHPLFSRSIALPISEERIDKIFDILCPDLVV